MYGHNVTTQLIRENRVSLNHYGRSLEINVVFTSYITLTLHLIKYIKENNIKLKI